MSQLNQARSTVFLRACLGLISIGVLSVDWQPKRVRAGEGPAATLAEKNTDSPDAQEPQKELFVGRVVRLSDALKEREIRTSEEMETHFVLQTNDGELIPILADWRGRALYQDARLRNRDIELVGFRRPGIPYVNVLMIFTFNGEGQRQYTDYWCDVCSIPMYEIKPCECCQGEIRLRYQVQDLPEYLTSPPAE